jgi:hypothetical protein
MTDTNVSFTPLQDHVWEVFYKRQNQAQMMDLSGVGHYHYNIQEEIDCTDDECAGLDPLYELQLDADYVLNNLIPSFVNHKHQWNENGFCWCGWDGNA